MSSKARKWGFRIADMLDAIEAIQNFTKDMDRTDFENSRMVRDAVAMNFQVIGENAYHIPEEVREQYSAVPWHSVTGLRHIISHDYARIEWDSIWDIIRNNLSDLKTELHNIADNEIE